MRSYPSIQFHISCPYTPQHNRLVERKHRQIVELGLASMFHARIPSQYWHDIFESVVFTINSIPSSSLDFSTPYHTLFQKNPDYSSLKYFDASAIHIFGLILLINLHHDQFSVFFLDIPTPTKGISVLICKLTRYTCQGMLFSMNVIFPSNFNPLSNNISCSCSVFFTFSYPKLIFS
jgi:hypothetical protein